MIGQLTGKPLLNSDALILDVHGVGYLVHVAEKTRAAAASVDTMTLLTYLHVTDSALELYGFEQQADLDLFELLLSVSGIGPKTAILITNQGAAAITQAVQQAQVTFFTQFPRVGKKLAQKIIIELTSKLGSLKELDLGPVSSAQQAVFDALLALGFSEQDIQTALETTDISDLSIEKAVTKLLKKLGS